MITLNCFILSYVKYGDHDAVLHCYCEDDGFQSFFAKGLFSSKSKKKGYVSPLNYLQISISKRNKSISNITHIELLNQYDYTNININTILWFISDFLNQILRNEADDRKIYFEIERFLAELYQLNFSAHLAFLYKLLSYLGISPLSGEGSFLNPETGTFSTTQSHHLFDANISAIWKNYLTKDVPYKIKLNRTNRNLFLETLMIYYTYHLPGFYQPYSLDVIRQIYNGN